MRIYAAIQGEYGRRIVDNIREHGPQDWEVFVWEAPRFLPVIVDDPEEFLPEDPPTNVLYNPALFTPVLPPMNVPFVEVLFNPADLPTRSKPPGPGAAKTTNSPIL